LAVGDNTAYQERLAFPVEAFLVEAALEEACPAVAFHAAGTLAETYRAAA
jgi:hypothetical protein